jgi:hypothetical protein
MTQHKFQNFEDRLLDLDTEEINHVKEAMGACSIILLDDDEAVKKLAELDEFSLYSPFRVASSIRGISPVDSPLQLIHIVRNSYFKDGVYIGPKITIFRDSNTYLTGARTQEERERREAQRQNIEDLLASLEGLDFYDVKQKIQVKKEVLGGSNLYPLSNEEKSGRHALEEMGVEKSPYVRFSDFVDDFYNNLRRRLPEKARAANLYSNPDNEQARDDVIKEILQEEFGIARSDPMYRSYSKLVSKLFNNTIKNNLDNLLVDVSLVTEGMAYNIFNPHSQSIIFTGDADISLHEDLLLRCIIPKYLAAVSTEEIEKQMTYFVQGKRKKMDKRFRDLLKQNYDFSVDPNFKQKMEDAAKEHIDYFRGFSWLPNQSLGIVYNYNKDTFKTFSVVNETAQHLLGDPTFRVGKSQFLFEMVLTGKSPEEILGRYFEPRKS